MLQVLEFNSFAQLAPWRKSWSKLLALTPLASFFLSYEWLEAFWRHAAPDRKLRVLVVHDRGAPVGILPLNVQTEQTQLGPVRLLGVPFDGWGSFYGPIGPQPAETLAAALQYLQAAPRDYDIVDIRCLRGVSDTAPLATTVADEKLTEWNRVAIIELAGTWDEYWASRKLVSSRHRDVERCERRLCDLGEVTHVRYRPRGAEHGENDPRWDLYDTCEALAGKSWQAGLTEGNTLSHAHVREFLRAAHVAAVAAGAADVNVLYLSGRPVAFSYGYHYRGYVDLMRIGFDPELAKAAPGNALWTRLIRDSYLRGDRLFDLGPTCLDYKKFWITRVEPTYRVLEYTLSPRSQALRLARWLGKPLKREVEQTNQASKADALAHLAAQAPLTPGLSAGLSSGSVEATNA